MSFSIDVPPAHPPSVIKLTHFPSSCLPSAPLLRRPRSSPPRHSVPTSAYGFLRFRRPSIRCQFPSTTLCCGALTPHSAPPPRPRAFPTSGHSHFPSRSPQCGPHSLCPLPFYFPNRSPRFHQILRCYSYLQTKRVLLNPLLVPFLVHFLQFRFNGYIVLYFCSVFGSPSLCANIPHHPSLVLSPFPPPHFPIPWYKISMFFNQPAFRSIYSTLILFFYPFFPFSASFCSALLAILTLCLGYRYLIDQNAYFTLIEVFSVPYSLIRSNIFLYFFSSFGCSFLTSSSLFPVAVYYLLCGSFPSYFLPWPSFFVSSVITFHNTSMCINPFSITFDKILIVLLITALITLSQIFYLSVPWIFPSILISFPFYFQSTFALHHHS